MASSENCDMNMKQENEGNVGQTTLFPWLGVLQVHIHEEGSFSVALTGLVLVKRGYAIANADDVSRVPKRIFKDDSKALFILQEGKTWMCRPVDYMTHPEYEYSTINTIALVELDPGKNQNFPMKPICWPKYSFNTSNELYAIGFTDENKLLEKSIFSMQYVEQQLCKEFYNREGLTDANLTPTQYQCAVTHRLRESCVWDNGMVLASNSTIYWTLVGFGIRGPGCAAPARFIHLLPYLPWIETATNMEMTGYRKTAFNEGFRKQLRDVGSHEADHLKELQLSKDSRLIQEQYPFDTETAQDTYFAIDRIEQDAISIRDVPGTDGNCTAKRLVLIYHDNTRIVAKHTDTPNVVGNITYKVSMYDLSFMNYSCAKIALKSTGRQDKCKIYYRTQIDNNEGTAFGQYGDTPDDLLTSYPIKDNAKLKAPGPLPGPESPFWEPGPHMKLHFIEDKEPFIKIPNYNILLTFEFEDEAIIEIFVYGHLQPTESFRPARRYDEAMSEKQIESFQENVQKLDESLANEDETNRDVEDAMINDRIETSRNVQDANKNGGIETNRGVEDAVINGGIKTNRGVEDAARNSGIEVNRHVVDSGRNIGIETNRDVEDTVKNYVNETNRDVEDAMRNGEIETNRDVEDAVANGWFDGESRVGKTAPSNLATYNRNLGFTNFGKILIASFKQVVVVEIFVIGFLHFNVFQKRY